MWVIDSPRARFGVAIGWLVFAGVNATLMYVFPGAETIPFHLIWASFAYLYGIAEWPRATAWPVVGTIVVVTGIALVHHAASGLIEWEECSEIVLMPLIVALLVWHVDRNKAARKRIAQLREAERHRAAQRELATRFGSHEIRTRLTIARGLVDLMGDDDDVLPWMARDCRMAAAELDKATSITHNLMTFVRAEDTTSPLLAVDLDELFDDVGLRWRSSADRDWQVQSTAGTHRCDPERLEAAVDCLIENAVKFTEPGDRIVISASVAAKDLVVSVSDSGAGIPPEDLDHVTELFRTGKSAGRRAGTGIGLAIVRAMTESRGGSIEISSTPGTGTTVTMRFPNRIPVELHKPAPAPKPELARTGG